MVVKINDDFLFEEKKDSLELDENLDETLYYDQLLVLTAIASYNREEGGGKIHGRQAMMGEKNIKIHIHCLAYKTALKGWELFLNGQISLELLAKKVHQVLLHGNEKLDFRVIPGELRKGTVYISGESGEVSDAIFICPAAQELQSGFKDIEEIIFSMLGKINSDTKIIGGYIHYLLTVLHPFQDGNGRLARILAITFLEYFGQKDSRGFTFLAEMLESDNIQGVCYGDTFGGDKEYVLTNKIKEVGTKKVYDINGMSSFDGNTDLSFKDYINALDIDNPAINFSKLLNILEEKKSIIAIIVEVFLKAKSLPGDHILIWKFINRLFDAIQNSINTGGKSIIVVDKEIINEVILLIDGKLKTSSVKNLLILLNHVKEKLSKLGISITIKENFFEVAAEDGILGTDVVTSRIKNKILGNIENT